MNDFEKMVEELVKQLDSSRQNWLFGAGISFKSNIPLMYPLTHRVEQIINSSGEAKDIEIFALLKNDLDTNAHIEHYLSHLGDLIALAERSRSLSAVIGTINYSKIELHHLHKSIIAAIGNTVRYGYVASTSTDPEIIGTLEKPLVPIEHHLEFVRALFRNRSNLLSRSNIAFFSTNYDTLLEDALALEKYIVVDGFSGGGLGFWNPEFEFNQKLSPNTLKLFKLHGSIDWHLDDTQSLVRARYGTKYLSNPSDIMIYPQATKYVETQKDPFAFLFAGLRNTLKVPEDNILVTCGYSFGDNHINSEIENSLKNKGSKTTLIAFSEEFPDASTGVVINSVLDRWINDKEIGARIYVAGKKGIYNNSTAVIEPIVKRELFWWTFSGLSQFLTDGSI